MVSCKYTNEGGALPMDNTLLYIALIILSAAAFVAIIGAFSMKFFIHRKDNKIEVISSDKDNSKN